MKTVLCFILLLCFGSFSLKAQYFYNDIYRTEQTNQEYQQYQKKGIHHISIKSFDAHRTINKGFSCEKELSDDFQRSVMRSSSYHTGYSVLISFFDEQGRVIRTLDSTRMSVNKTGFYYNSEGHIDSLIFFSYSNATPDTFLYNKTTFHYREKHIYHYNDEGELLKMERIKNGIPYSTVIFRTDSLGRVTKENEQGKYFNTPPYYYKYDTAGRLTDVFHFNAEKQKMIPDYLLDYDEQGRLTGRTTVMMNTRDYLLWKYFYTSDGLISKEECYGNKHQLKGILKFSYSN